MSLKRDIVEWKKQYKDIYQVEVGDREGSFSHTFIFRKITKKEYNDFILMNMSQAELEEAVSSLCTLSPIYDFTRGRAGVADILSNLIIQHSHLMEGQSDRVLAKHREEMTYFDYQIECIIHEAFPSIPLEEISNWTIEKSMYYLSRAEWILTNLRGIPLQYQENEPQQQNPTPEQQQYEHSFTSEQAAPPVDKEKEFSETKKEGQLSEAELMDMLQQNEAKSGRQINPKGSFNNEVFPELGWFKDDEIIKGEFD